MRVRPSMSETCQQRAEGSAMRSNYLSRNNGTQDRHKVERRDKHLYLGACEIHVFFEQHDHCRDDSDIVSEQNRVEGGTEGGLDAHAAGG